MNFCVSDSEAYPLSSVAIVLLELSCLETLVMAFVVILEDKSCTDVLAAIIAVSSVSNFQIL